jgi:hypothetical protein
VYTIYTDGILSAAGLYRKKQKELEATTLGAIHRYSITRFLTGTFDELRLCTTSRSAAWVKLSYENQKPGSKLLKFE